MAIDRITSHIAESEQILLKKSRDDKYDVLAVMALGEDGNTARRIKVDSTGSIETTLDGLVDTLQELVQRLAPLAGAMANTAQLRVVAGTTVVTGPITSAQSIAEKATGGVSYTSRVAQENLTAIISNVNNCTGV